jgi:hypothetical protein
VVLTLVVAVVLLDQAAKWWAWRHVWWTRINSGGDVLVGPTIGAWYAGPVTGALLDLLDFGLLSIAVSVLARCRATAAVGVPGALMTGGWGSNLFDRLGMHYWTAPGSVRGVVDFIYTASTTTTPRTSSSSAARRSSCWQPDTAACGRRADRSRPGAHRCLRAVGT